MWCPVVRHVRATRRPQAYVYACYPLSASPSPSLFVCTLPQQVNVSIKPDRRDMRVLAFEDRHDCAFAVSLLARWPDFEGSDPQVGTVRPYGHTVVIAERCAGPRTGPQTVLPYA